MNKDRGTLPSAEIFNQSSDFHADNTAVIAAEQIIRESVYNQSYFTRVCRFAAVCLMTTGAAMQGYPIPRPGLKYWD